MLMKKYFSPLYLIIIFSFINCEVIFSQKSVWVSSQSMQFPLQKFKNCNKNVISGRYVTFSESGDTAYQLKINFKGEKIEAEYSTGYVASDEKDKIKLKNFSINNGKVLSDKINGNVVCLSIKNSKGQLNEIWGLLINDPFSPTELIFLELL